MALLSDGEDARKQGTTSLTQNEHNRSWSRWLQFLKSLDFKDDPYLVIIPDHGNAQSPYQSSPKPSVKLASLHQLSLPWLKEQSNPPLTTWLRPSGMVSVHIPSLMTMENFRSFFHSNTAATETSTKTSNNRKSSRSSSFANSLRLAPPSKTLQ